MEQEITSKKSKSRPAQASPVEAVVRIPLEQLRPFPDHPFKVRDDDAIRETVETIEREQATPSLSQTQRMRRMSEAGALNKDTMLRV